MTLQLRRPAKLKWNVLVQIYAGHHVLSPLLTITLCKVTKSYWVSANSWELETTTASLKWISLWRHPAGLPSSSGDVVVYVKDINQPSLPTPFYFVLVSISFFVVVVFLVFSGVVLLHKLSVFSLCSSGLISALLVLSTIFLSMKSLLQPRYNP